MRDFEISLAGLLAWALMSGAALAAPDEALLGKAEGYPVCQLDDANIGPDRCLVGLFSHFDEAYPARKVARGGPVRKLGQAIFVDPVTKLVVVFIAAHAAADFPSRRDQYALFYAALRALQSQPRWASQLRNPFDGVPFCRTRRIL